MEKEYRFEVFTDIKNGYKQYVVKYFDFDNLFGVGDTIEEAIEEAKGNLKFYIDYCKDKNIPVPSPSVHESNGYSGKVTLRMSKSLHKLVDERAKNEGVSINALLNEAVSSYIFSANTANEIEEKASNKIRNAALEAYNTKIEYLSDDNVLSSNNKTNFEKDTLIV